MSTPLKPCSTCGERPRLKFGTHCFRCWGRANIPHIARGVAADLRTVEFAERVIEAARPPRKTAPAVVEIMGLDGWWHPVVEIAERTAALEYARALGSSGLKVRVAA